MFGKRFGKKGGEIQILAPVAGEVIPVGKVNDPTFSEEILGKGLAIKPSGGQVVAPVNGTVEQMFDTGHAVSLLSEDGVELLVHVGLDTISLKGEHYTIHAKTGDTVKVGDLLMEFDREAIAAAGFDTVTPIVILNSADFKEVGMQTGKTVGELGEIITIKK